MLQLYILKMLLLEHGFVKEIQELDSVFDHRYWLILDRLDPPRFEVGYPGAQCDLAHHARFPDFPDRSLCNPIRAEE